MFKAFPYGFRREGRDKTVSRALRGKLDKFEVEARGAAVDASSKDRGAQLSGTRGICLLLDPQSPLFSRRCAYSVMEGLP